MEGNVANVASPKNKTETFLKKLPKKYQTPK